MLQCQKKTLETENRKCLGKTSGSFTRRTAFYLIALLEFLPPQLSEQLNIIGLARELQMFLGLTGSSGPEHARILMEVCKTGRVDHP